MRLYQMKKASNGSGRRQLATAVAAMSLATSAAAFTTGNLLVNPGAESGAATGWTVTSGQLGRFSSSSNEGYGAAEGIYYFYGGTSAFSQARQDVHLLSFLSANAVDNGEAKLDVSYWARSYTDSGFLGIGDGTHDSGSVIVEFLNASGQRISTAYSRQDLKPPFWSLFGQDNIAVPVGTRTVRYWMGFLRDQGTDNDGYLDGNSVNIDYTSNVYWKSAVSGNWSDNSKWSAVVPNAGEDVVLNKSGNYSVNLNMLARSRNLSILNGNVTFTGNPGYLGIVGGNLSLGVTAGVPASLKLTRETSLYLDGAGAHDIGKNAGAVGTLTVDGSGTALNNSSGWLGVGNAGAGTLVIANGGDVSVASGYVGYGNGGVGVIDISGAGSRYVGTSLTLGGNSAKTTIGKGMVNLHDGGSLDLGSTLNVYNTSGTAINFSGGTLSAANINLDGNGGRFNWSAGTLELLGGSISNFGSTFTVPALGTFNGTGTVAGKLVVNGNVAPGGSLGALRVNGDLSGTGRFTMQIGSSTFYDQLKATGSANLNDAIIEVELFDGYEPSSETSFDLFDFAGILGGTWTFDFSNAQLPPGMGWDTSGFATTGTIVAVVPEPASLSLLALAGVLALRRRRCQA
jgi:T5SS/PEP-CTERM-associated repeat protein